MKRRKKNKGSSGNKELIKNSEKSDAARLIPEREKNKTAAQAYTGTKMRQRDIKRPSGRKQ